MWRETWRGHTYAVIPVRVVEDNEREIAVYLAEGTEFHFRAGGWPFEEVHSRVGRGAWSGQGVLVLHRYGTAHAI